MQHWHLPSVHSTDKQTYRQTGSDAPRTDSTDKLKPQVLFSYPACRAVLVPLAAGEQMRDHAVHERATVQIVSGHVTFILTNSTVDCPAGTLVCLEPGEHHAVEAHEDSRLLLMLAPWQAHAHEADKTPRNATARAEG